MEIKKKNRNQEKKNKFVHTHRLAYGNYQMLLDKKVIQLYNCITMNYVTTNIRLPEEDYLRLKEEAAKARKSFSAIVREKVGSKKKLSREKWLKEIMTMDTSWFTEKDYQEYQKMRREEKKLADKKYNW